MSWYNEPCALPCEKSRDAASARQNLLTKPAGSLGKLESLAVQFAAWQGRALPRLNNIAVHVYAADHGITAQGVSAFPAEVTAQMVENFVLGGAAISVLGRELGAEFKIVNVGTFDALPDRPGLDNIQLAPGSRDFSREPALNTELLESCLSLGRNTVDALVACDLFIAGEMGIGNTSSAAALIAATLELPADAVTGRGTGIDDVTLQHKTRVLQAALDLHADQLDSPLAILRCLGGLEIATMVGAYIRCAQRGIPALLDGFIATAAALIACKINPGARQWLLAAHQSAEAGHKITLEAMELSPLLQLDMRLGEGSGAAVAVPIIRSALTLHGSMATFDQAGVAESER